MHLPKNSNDDTNQNGKSSIGGSQAEVERVSVEPDFTDFLWMADEDLDEFDRQVISEMDERFGLEKPLEEEEENFLHTMLHEEEERDTVYFRRSHDRRVAYPADLNCKPHSINIAANDILKQSNLNPNAAEFFPRQEHFVPSASSVAPPDAAAFFRPPFSSSSSSDHRSSIVAGPNHEDAAHSTSLNPLVREGRADLQRLRGHEVNGDAAFSQHDQFYSSRGTPIYISNAPMWIPPPAGVLDSPYMISSDPSIFLPRNTDILRGMEEDDFHH